MTRPIVFLDIDGVLNGRIARGPALHELLRLPEDERPAASVAWIEPPLVGRLNAITSATGADIVVHSSWRLLFTAEHVLATLRLAGVQANLIGTTGGQERMGRGNSIRAWLYDNSHHVDPFPFVVLDDEDMSREDVIGHRQILTHERDGLTDDHVVRAVALLAAA